MGFMPPYDNQHNYKDDKPPKHNSNIFSDKGTRKSFRYLEQLHDNENKYVCRQQRVDDRVIGNEDQKAM